MQTKFREALRAGRVRWRAHAQQRMLERGILRRDVGSVIEHGRIIEEYQDDKPYPSFLIYGSVGNRPLHVLVAYNEGSSTLYVITAYEPDDVHFGPDHVTRRREK